MATECDIPDTGLKVEKDEIFNLLNVILNRKCDVNISQVRKISKLINKEVKDLNSNIDKNKQLNIINIITVCIFILLLIMLIIKI